MADASSSSLPIDPTSLSERLASAMRDEDVRTLQRLSPAAACLGPLLEALGKQDYLREAIEALPYDVGELDLVDLRNMLVHLGYESDECPGEITKLDPDLLPALFVDDEGGFYVVVSQGEDSLRVFDAHACCFVSWRKTEEHSGVTYIFTDTFATHAIEVQSSVRGGWFGDCLSRFSHLITHLLMASFALSVLGLSLPLLVLMVADGVLQHGRLEQVPYLAAGFLLIALFECYLRFLRGRTLSVLSGRLSFLVSVSALRHLQQRLDLDKKHPLWGQYTQLTQFENIRNFFSGSSAEVLLDLLFLIVPFAALFAIGGSWAFIPTGMVALFVLAALVLSFDLVRGARREILLAAARGRHVMESVMGGRDINATGSGQRWSELYREVSGSASTADYEVEKRRVLLDALGRIWAGLTVLVMVMILGMGAADRLYSLGEMLAIMVLTIRIVLPLCVTGKTMLAVARLFESSSELNRFMAEAKKREASNLADSPPRISGAVAIDSVSFGFGGSARLALSEISLKIRPRTVVGVAGPNGSGKSTLLKVMAGFYEPHVGSVRYDSFDLQHLNVRDVRQMVAYLPQDVALFRGTIAENLRLNFPQATEDHIIEAAIRAGIYPHVEGLPLGFETPVSDELLKRMPHGIAHGIALARTYVRKAPIVLLDEPSAMLDEFAAYNLAENVDQMRQEHTIFMVTNHPTRLLTCDEVLLLRKGKVVLFAPPKEALKRMAEMELE